jgi:hypothetical protein
MAQSYLQRVADELADLALADHEASGDIGIVDLIGDVLGASSQTLQETYLTSIRVRRAETRAREMLGQRKANNYAEAPKPKAAPLQGVKEDPEEPQVEEAPEVDEVATDAPAKPASGMPRRVTR